MKTLFALVALAAMAIFSSCGNGSGDSSNVAQNPLLAPGSSVAEVHWSQVSGMGMDQVRLQLDPRQDPDRQTWDGEDVVHLVRQLPDSMSVQLSATLSYGSPQQAGDPDHDHDHGHDHGHGHHGRPRSRAQVVQGALFRIFAANAASGIENGGLGSSAGERAAQLRFDSAGTLNVQLNGVSSLIQYPSCGSSWILEIDLRRARIRLPLEIDC